MKFFERRRRQRRLNRCRELLRVDIEIANEDDPARIEHIVTRVRGFRNINVCGMESYGITCGVTLLSNHHFNADKPKCVDAIKAASFDAITELLEQA